MKRSASRRNVARPPRFRRPGTSASSHRPAFRFTARGFGNGLLAFIIAHRVGITIFALGLFSGLYLRGCFTQFDVVIDDERADDVAIVSEKKPKGPDLHNPVREAPEKFKRNTYLPAIREGDASVSVSDVDFSAGRDLVYVADDRAWWESDNDGDDDDECDHTMHAAMEIPFRRLINLIVAAGWQPRVQEAYRASGVHANRSLHKQGRALDITIDRVGEPKLTHFEKIAAYEELSKLAWQAGFDWVFYEYGSGTGPHIHASVRPDGPRMADFTVKPKSKKGKGK